MVSHEKVNLNGWHDDGIHYRLAEPADEEAIHQLQMQEFFPNMPLFQIPPCNIDADLMRSRVPMRIKEGVSLVAVDSETGELIGCRINSVESKDFVNPIKGADPEKFRRMHQIFHFIWTLESAVDCFEMFNVDKALCFRALTVKQSYGRRGIGKKLNIFSIELAKSLGLPLIKGSTEMLYSQRINESLGFMPVYRIAYKDYVDAVTGERPFTELQHTVHKEAVMFAKLIHQ